jgi:large subunit ribosomal protein L20
MQYAYRGRKEKKRNFRALWITVLTLELESTECLTPIYGALKKNNIELNRKVLADLSNEPP